jgi:pimeloyl-ACP methyl ester carboxylesterase
VTSAIPQTITLPDGRELCWAEYGDPQGEPVFYFHGGPGSRLPIWPRQDEVATSLGIRLLCPERPGFGESTRHPERTLTGWTDDVAALADAIALGSFSVVGYSAGGPHALACAAKLGDRLTRAVTVGCLAPWDLPELARHMDLPRRMLRLLAQRAPWLLRLTYRSLPEPRRHPEKLVRKMLAGLSEPDQVVLAQPEVFKLGVDHTIAGLTQGFEGMADEVLILARPWGFDIAEIALPVIVWCGREDTAAPLDQAEHLASLIPRAELRLIDGEGHLCIVEHWAEILESAKT